MLRPLIIKMKKFFGQFRTRIDAAIDTLFEKATTQLQRFRPRKIPEVSEPLVQTSPLPTLDDSLDVFTKSLMTAANRQANPDYLPLGSTHDMVSPIGLYLLSQQRDYIVYTPPGYQLEEQLPMVVVLHGCRQNHHDIRAISGFDAIADRERFIVVYPYVTSYLGMRNLNCWAWWQRFHIRAGSGEVEDLRRIIVQVQNEFNVDSRRIHITGLSSGAGMTVAALVAHGKLFASGASVAGVAYGESARAVRISQFMKIKYRRLAVTVQRMNSQLRGKGDLAPLLVIQSQNDQTVEPQSAINLRDSWLAVKGVRKQQPLPISGENQSIKWEYKRYQQGRRITPVETLLVDQLKHAWIGANHGNYGESRGPNISEIIWLFFKRHPR